MADMDFNFQNEEDQKHRIIKDESKLEIDYVPERIKFRGEQMNEIAQHTLQDIATGRKGGDILLLGPPGTGKTATVKFLKRKTEENNDTTLFNIKYINCSNHSSAQSVFKELCNEVGTEIKKGVNLSENINRFKSNLAEQEYDSLLVILDEAQNLLNKRREHLSKPILYHLSRAREIGDFSNLKISVIAVSNDQNLDDHIDSDVKSSMEEKTIHFAKYNEEEIMDILEERQKEAFKKQILCRAALRKIARELKDNFDSDIRKGIEIMKKIPEMANDIEELEESQQDQVDIVKHIIEDIQRDRIKSLMYSREDDFYLVMSSLHQQLMNGKRRLKFVVDGYEEACREAQREKKGDSRNKTKNYVYRQIEELIDAGLLEKKITPSGNRYPEYHAKFDLEDFLQITNDMLERAGLLRRLQDDRFKDYEDSKSEVEQEAEEKMQKMM